MEFRILGPLDVRDGDRKFALGGTRQRALLEALLYTDSFDDLPGKWQAAILEAEQNRPQLRVVKPD